ncbi:MAG TPA: hypothetical protein VGX23_26800 [Actinocrinis sp.]|nr:hypothetical protein [Actinocrinis sp.]
MRTTLTTALTTLLIAGAALLPASARADGPTSPNPAPTGLSATFSDHGSFGLQLMDAPTAEANDPRAKEYIIDNLQPGDVIHRRVELYSAGSSDLQASVYPDAATISGGSFNGDPGATASELTTWISTSQNTVTIPAGSYAIDTVTIAVPKDAAPGERYGVIWAQVTRPGANGTLTTVNRVGIRIYLNVGGDNPSASSLAVDTLTAGRNAKGQDTVKALVHNTGGRALDLNGTVTLTSVSGSLSAGPYEVELGTTLAPGQTEPVTAVIPGQIPNGPWTATVELRSGLLDQTYAGKITFPNAPGAAAAVAAYVVGRRSHTGLITGAAAGLVMLGAVAVPVARRRRR